MSSRTLVTTVAKSKRAQTPFILSHELKYGLKIVTRHVHTRAVESVRCLFCVYHGREEIVGQKRQRQKTVNCKTWEVFRSDAYVKHHVQQHPTAWKLYDAADADDKKQFFLDKMEHKNTLHAHLGNASTPLTFSFDAAIIDDIILSAFFDEDEIDSSSYRRAVKLFQKVVDRESDGAYHYTSTINRAMQFQLTARFLAIGMSFRQIERAVDATREVANVAKLGTLNEMLGWRLCPYPRQRRACRCSATFCKQQAGTTD
ncbi:hypothetical protein MARPO_0029s0074 [Marchantia polymorpha]|uniref:Uncharacterized protein n=1 Tax=Marchantia polymorpha TaxID=3197 RepID=A0A2R6X8Y0_MARPO|nr:hypothetical protein MARPO_0029s0074 [Marchantia polymorpha]|eukprot:PTQ42544.1 hypothetical protein MARPO_0029s0074 [Marchantia polymorpha]